MKKRSKKLLIILCAVILSVITPFSALAGANVALNVNENVSASATPDSKLEARELGGGRMKYKVPSAWKAVESDLTGIEGKLYKLNELQGNKKSAAEQLYVFYFSNEKYLLNQGDGGNREGIEKAIIKNILPNEHIAKLNVSGITFPTSRISTDGFLGFGNRAFDYFDTTYKDKNKKLHNAEFVFLPAGKKGMCSILYVYTDSVHKADIIKLLQDMEAK